MTHTIQIPAKLTLSAAAFMREESLVMRNTYTKQLSSLHYGGGHCPDTHGAAKGIYSVPLWTVAIYDLLTKEGSQKQLIEEHYTAIDESKHLKNKDHIFHELLDRQLCTANPTEQEQHLDLFLDAIKTFITMFTSFGTESRNGFEYELLIAKGSDNFWPTLVDDYGRYPTGGRVSTVQLSPTNIMYRVTFNSLEIEFFQSILSKAHDDIIFSKHELPGNIEVAASIRLRLCNSLAAEIIVTKLVAYLNAHGKLNKVLCLNKPQLISLLNIVCCNEEKEIKCILENEHISIHLQRDYSQAKPYPLTSKAPETCSKHISLNRYATFLYQKFSGHEKKLDKLRSIYFFLCEQRAKHPKNHPLHQNAVSLLAQIHDFCNLEKFDPEKFNLIKSNYHGYKFGYQFLDKRYKVQQAKLLEKELTMHLLNNFLLVLGSAAVALALTATLMGGVGIASILLGSSGLISLSYGAYGLFNSSKNTSGIDGTVGTVARISVA